MRKPSSGRSRPRPMAWFGLLIFAVIAGACDSPSDPDPEDPDPPQVSSVRISPSIGQLLIGDTVRLGAEAVDAAGTTIPNKSFTWNVSDPSVATIDSNGLLAGVSQGTVEVTASVDGISGDAVAEVVSIQLYEDVVIIDSLTARLVSSDAEIAAGLYRFTLQQQLAPAPPDVGDIIVGAESGGFMRRVEAVESATDQEWVLRTQPATLEEVIERGSFSSRFSLSNAEEYALQSTGRRTVVETVYLSPLASRIDTGIEINGNLCELLGAGIDCGVQGGGQITVSDGLLNFDVDIVMEGEYNAGTEYLAFGLEGGIDTGLKVDASVSSGVHIEAPLVEQRFIHVISAFPPLVAVGKFSVNIGVEIDDSSHLTLEVGGGFTSNVRSVIEYEHGDWGMDSSGQYDLEPITVAVETSEQSRLKVFLRPEVDFRIMGVAGPNASLPGHLAWTTGRTTTTPVTCFKDFGYGLDVRVGFKVGAFGSSFVEGFAEGSLFGETTRFQEMPCGNARIYGSVVDLHTLAALSGTSLALTPLATGSVQTTTADGAGAYEFPELAPGTYELRAEHPNYQGNLADNVQIIDVAAGDVVRVDFALAPTSFPNPIANVAGKVNDALGTPLNDATVQISGGVQTNGIFKTTTTGDDGTYTLTGITLTDPVGDPIESFTIIASKPGYAAKSVGEIQLAQNETLTNVDFILEEATGSSEFFSDGFESGLSWATSGFWNRSDGQDIQNEAYPEYVNLAPDDASNAVLPTASEGNYYAWYGDPAVGNFLGEQSVTDVPGSGGTSILFNAGELISPPFIIPPGVATATLSFDTWFEIESVNPNESGFDLMIVGIEDVGSGEVFQLGRLNPFVDPDVPDRMAIPFTSGGFNRAPVFGPVFFPLNEFVGRELRIVLRFDTRDHLYNGFRGWIVDNVRVSDIEPPQNSQLSITRLDDVASTQPVGTRCGEEICWNIAPSQEREH